MSLLGKFIKFRYWYNISSHEQDNIFVHAKVIAESSAKACVLGKIRDEDFAKLQKLNYEKLQRQLIIRLWDDIFDVIDDESLINWADEAKKLDNLIK